MIKSLRRLGLACLAAAITASPAAAHYDEWRAHSVSCGCRAHAPAVSHHSLPRPVLRTYESQESYSQYQPAAVIRRSPARSQAALYYSSDEAEAQYYPVVIPLEEFLNPGKPVALTRDEVARQRQAAEARVIPPQHPQSAMPPATTAEADPFQDDATADEPPTTTEEPPTPDEPTTDEPAAPAGEDAFAEEAMPAEEPPPAEAEPMPEAEAPPAAADSDDDPFNDL